MDILVKSIETNDSCYTEQRKDENYCLNRGHKLFISENWLEVVKVNHDIASILFLEYMFYHLVKALDLIPK